MDLEVGEIVPLPLQDLHFLRFYILGYFQDVYLI